MGVLQSREKSDDARRQEARLALQQLGLREYVIEHNFPNKVLDHLVRHGYHNVAALRAATVKSLLSSGLLPACADLIHGAQAIPATRIKLYNVFRLKRGTSTVGTACLVKYQGVCYIIIPRRCMNPSPQHDINTARYRLCGCKVKHVRSFPRLNVTVLKLGSEKMPKELQEAHPFRVDGGVGLVEGMGVTLVTYPLSVERTVQGSEPSNEPVVAHGRVNEIVPGAEKAIGSYHVDLPSSCSGGAVVLTLQPASLIGMHLGAPAPGQQQGQNARDLASSSDQAPRAAGVRRSAAAAPRAFVEVEETTKWVRGDEADKVDRLESPGGDSADMPHCANMGQPHYFVPAATLCRLLRKCFLQPRSADY